MIGSIKKLLSGILSFFVGLLRGNKSQDKPSLEGAANELGDKAKELPGKVTGKTRRRSGYFMELEDEDPNPLQAVKQSANGIAAKISESVTNTAKTVKEEVAKTPVATAAKPAKNESTKTPETAATTQAANVELIQDAEGVMAVPAKREKSPAASTNGQTPTETTFAPKYLAPDTSSNSRRRPGPSMNPFLDMARQVKTPG